MRAFLRQQAPIAGMYFVLALIITFPVILSPHTQFIGGENGDSYEMARHIWWFKTALVSGQSPFWQSNLGYPDGFSGVSLQADVLQFFPMWLFVFVVPLALAFNLTIWLTMALNGWAMYWLARDLLAAETLDKSAQQMGALLAGVIFMAAPTFQGHLFEGHAGLIVQWGAPLYLWALFRLVNAKTLQWRWLALAILFFQITPSGHMLQVIYMLMPVTALFLMARLYRRDWAGVQRILLMGAVSGGLLLLFLIPLIQETLAQTAYTDTGGYVRYSADALAIASPSFLHPVFGKLLPYTRQVLGVNLGESSMYLGIVAAVLAGIGIAKFRATRWWLLLAGVAWILALGPLLKVLDKPVQLTLGEYTTYITLPLALVQNMPGFNLARTPGRFNFALALALAVLAGYGAAWLWQNLTPQGSVYAPRLPLEPLLETLSQGGQGGASGEGETINLIPPNRRIIPARYIMMGVLVALILFEYQMFFPMPTRPAQIPDAVYALRERDDIRAVFDVPYEHLLGAKDALYLQTAHEKPLIAGQVTRSTPVNPAKLAVMQTTLDPALLQSRGADIVILHKQRAAQIDQLETLQGLLRLKFPPPIYEDDTIAIYETPDTTAEPMFAYAAPRAASITATYAASVYTPGATWMDFTADIEADGRDLDIYLDDRLIHRAHIDGTHLLRVPLPVSQEGFYTIRLKPDPPCPVLIDPVLQCRDVRLNAINVMPISEGILYDLIRYEGGVELAGSYFEETAATLDVFLWWRFSEALADTDVRFVHLLDDAGNNVAQSDIALGAHTADSEWTETVRLNIAELPPGEYRLRVGWYDYHTLLRFRVLTENLVGGQDDAPEIGRITKE